MATQTFRVAGMSCDHCVHAVSDELAKLPGVHDVAVELASGTVTLEADRDLDTSAIAAAVEEAGYELAS